MKAKYLIIASCICLLTSCDGPGSSTITVEAPDYSPIGEGVKFLALALLGAAVVFSIASMINNGRDDQ